MPFQVPFLRRKAAVRPHRRYRPRVEALDERTLPSTLTVLNPSDSGPGSLRDAIAQASAGDTIVFDRSLSGQTITLTSGPLAIGKNLTIDGPGSDRLTISGNGASRVFTVGSGDTVVLNHLAITQGFADQGGGIDNAGTLTLTDCSLSGNQAVADSATSGVGGAILNEAGATLTVVHSRFQNNQVFGGSVGLGQGGAVMSFGQATIRDSRFTDNVANGGPAGPFAIGAGGAVSNQGGATMTITASTFRNNTALDGGGIQSAGGALDNEWHGTLTVTDSTFDANHAGAPHTTGGNGGAIFNFLGTLIVARSQFTNNLADGLQYGESGAIDNEFASATISDSRFTGNKAYGYGPGGSGFGGVMTNVHGSVAFTTCAFSGNQAQATGGADGAATFDQALGGAFENISAASLSLTNCVVKNNVAQGGNGDTNGPFQAFGWAFGGGVMNLFNSSLTVTNTQFVGNQALAGSGNGIAPQGYGGGIDNDVGSTLQVTGSSFIGNRAVGGAGGPGTAGGVALGGGILNQFNSTATISTTVLIGNQAVGGAGGTGAPGGDGVGGGLVDGHVFGPGADASTMTLTNVAVIGNLALGGAGSVGGDGLGGGVFVGVQGETTAVTLSVTGGAFIGNQAIGAPGGNGIGGGLYIDPGATAGGSQTHVLGNHASTQADDVFGIFNLS